MKTSKFQFINPYLTKLNFHINENYKSQNEIIDINCSMNVSINRIENKPLAFVSLNVILGENNETSPFFVDCEMVSEFNWDNNSYDEKTISDFLSLNAPSLLLGYIRPIISQITGLSSYPAYDIPFYNFLDDDE